MTGRPISTVANFKNLFGGNKFLEQIGNSLINQNINILLYPFQSKVFDLFAAISLEFFDEYFLGSTKDVIESFFPEVSIVNKKVIK
jgi:hypothetical protein